MKRLHRILLAAAVAAAAAVALGLGVGFGATTATVLAPAVWQADVSNPAAINHGSDLSSGRMLTSVTIPRGEYVLLAKLDLANHSSQVGSVIVDLHGPAGTYDTTTVTVPATHTTTTLVPLMATVRLATPQTIEVRAVAVTPHSNTAVQANNIKLIAFSVNAFAT